MTNLPMTSPGEPRADAVERAPPDAAIRESVVASLGRPPELYRVAVMPLWQDHYRVNVLVGSDLTTLRVAHSYFVEAGEGGRIVKATPPLTRMYF
jgi:hypothetical protein